MEITIRKAGIESLPLLMEWRMRVLREVFADYQEVDWETLRANNEAYYREQLAGGGHTACFACDQTGAVIGCGGICYQLEMPSPDNISGTCGYLMNIFALPEVRGQGVGRKIVDFLIADARARQTEKIYLESSEIALHMYERIGFTPMQDYYKL